MGKRVTQGNAFMPQTKRHMWLQLTVLRDGLLDVLERERRSSAQVFPLCGARGAKVICMDIYVKQENLER